MPNGDGGYAAPLPPLKIIASGTTAALVGIALFLGVHAVLIVPVWPTPMRTIIAVLIGATAAWAFEELLAAGALSRRLVGGAAFGGIMWLILVPMPFSFSCRYTLRMVSTTQRVSVITCLFVKRIVVQAIARSRESRFESCKIALGEVWTPPSTSTTSRVRAW